MRAKRLIYLAAVGATLATIVWTESYSWQHVDELRQRAVQGVTPEEIGALHRIMTWSSLLLLLLGPTLVVLVYQGFIAPLRERLRHTQGIIAQQEKLSSLGILAAGIAHEIRNPLTSIKVRLFTQQQLLTKGSEEFEDNVFLAEEITRLERIVKDFLAFARPSEPHLVVIQATQALRELLPLLAPELKRSRIEVREEFIADPPIRVDPVQLKQVLINLVRNAAEAMGADGLIILRTRVERRGLGTRAHNWSIIEVEDRGPGIPADVEQRLFDPFFTTKATGTGLGLSIATRILEKHGGSLEYSTVLHHGTTFRIALPVAEDDRP